MKRRGFVGGIAASAAALAVVRPSTVEAADTAEASTASTVRIGEPRRLIDGRYALKVSSSDGKVAELHADSVEALYALLYSDPRP